MGKTRSRVRKVVGALLSGTTFSLVLLLLVRGFGWPGPSLLLVGMVGVAWLAGTLAGAKLTGRWASGSATLLALLLLGSTGVTAFLGQNTAKPVYYRVDATFAYVGSEDNRHLENVIVFFPLPRAENGDEVGRYFMGWKLYKVEENGVLYLQQTCSYGNIDYGSPSFFLDLRPPRTEPIVGIIGGIGWRESVEGRYIEGRLFFDRIYPGEIIWAYAFVQTSQKKVTLRLPGDNRSSGLIWMFPSGGYRRDLGCSAHVVIWAQLSKLTKVSENKMRWIKVSGEEYRRDIDNFTGGGLYLYPL